MKPQFLAGLCFVGASLSGFWTSLGQEKADKPLMSKAITSLKNSAPAPEEMLKGLERISQGESSYAKVARQTVCMLKLRQGDYRSIWAVLSQLPKPTTTQQAESLEWADQRILLWLSMEARRNDRASELLKAAVVRSLAIDEKSVSRGRLDADFLGVLCAIAKSDPSQDRINESVVAKAIELMAKHPRQSLAQAFNRSFQGTCQEIRHLESAINSVEQLVDSEFEMELAKAKTAFEQASEALEQSTGELAATKKLAKDLDASITKTKKYGIQTQNLLYNTEESGKPSPPEVPKKPESKFERTGPKGERIEIPPSASEMNRYRGQLAKYNADLQSYPFRFAQWSQRNEERKVRLANQIMVAKAKLVELQKEHAMQLDRVGALEKSHSLEICRHKDVKWRLRGLELSRAQRESPQGFESLYRPSLYQAIDWQAESDRLLKELQRY